MNLLIREMLESDWQEVARIYYDGIQTNLATFQRDIPTYKEWNRSHLEKFRYVCLVENKIVAWCALSHVSSRDVYSGVVELSVYVDEKFRNLKIGSQLINHLIKEVESNDIWTIQS